ncbi:hypothetical protein BH11PSE11_BH11PSE11_29610 [soil metagenome]
MISSTTDPSPATLASSHAVRQPLLKAGALQDAIFNSANFSCIATDAEGVIQIFNVGAERMLGYLAADVVDKLTPACISDGSEMITRAAALSLELDATISPGFEALVFKASRGIEDVYELTYVRKNGSRFPAVVSVTALRDPHENIIGYLLIGTDNSSQKQIEARQALLDQNLREHQRRLQETNAELEKANAVAEKASRAKSEFLSSMSHELRTPLNAVLGFAQLLASDTPPPSDAQQQSIDRILQAGWYLLRLINEILDLAMIESGKLTMSREAMSLVDVLHDCRGMIELQATHRGIHLTFPELDDLFYVHADRTRVKQIMVNLLSNAIKYNRPGGAVVVTCVMNGPSRVRVSVSDSGFGMTADQQAQLFQPFNRLGKETGSEEGTGIGLVVTKQLVELMGGEIGVVSTADVGSVFWVDLPTSSAPGLVFEPGGDYGANRYPESALPEPVVQHTLLYVEDNPANLALVEQLIARRGDLKLLAATDANRGIQLARTFLPKVILMDINLPGMSGFGALKILREGPTTAHIPVIALSANAIPRDIEKGLDAGFFRYLTKPIKVEEFMGTLDVVMRHVDECTLASSSAAGGLNTFRSGPLPKAD